MNLENKIFDMLNKGYEIRLSRYSNLDAYEVYARYVSEDGTTHNVMRIIPSVELLTSSAPIFSIILERVEGELDRIVTSKEQKDD